MFLRVVASRNIRTRSRRTPITAKNSPSSPGGNVAVKHTNGAPNSCTVRPNARNVGRNPLDPSNTTWHSSNTTRSNCCRRCNRPTKSRNPSVMADSGVTNTTVAAVLACPPRHIVDPMPALEHRASMSLRNATNGVTTIVTPSDAQYAGNMNDKLLPLPVPITCTTGSSPRMIDRITASCWPRNAACGFPIICRNCPATLANCNRVNRFRRSLSHSSSNAIARRFVDAPPPRSSAPNPNNRCHCRLTARYLSRIAAVLNGASWCNRPYIIPATRVPCPACKSAALSSTPTSSSPSSLPSARPNASFKYRFAIATAMCRHPLMLILLPTNRSLCCCMMRRALSDVHVRSSFHGGVLILTPWLLLSLFWPASSSSLSSSLPSPLGPAASLSTTTSSAHKNALFWSVLCTIPCTCCQNGNTNHKYHTNNSPTSRGKYRWITLAFPVCR
ncbi:hypothetical protein QIS74_02557 [Colletotrichum tabaci]|uniref:Uncharacterized protein n=1 Tax=Colletotrichum tabaci TaxID=1209068 RepID=A0AAV9TKM1_9PEZI